MSNNKYIEADTDLQQLKSQYADFKEHLDNQPILTPTLIQTAIKSKVKSVNTVIRNLTFACVVAIVLWLSLGVFFKFSWIFTIITCLFMAADTIADNWTVWPLRKLFEPTTTLLEAAAMVAKSRRRMSACFATGVVTLMPWFVWLAWEFFNSPVCKIETEFNLALLFSILAAIGMIIGLIVATKIIRKLRRNLIEIDKNIKECLLEAEDNE